MLRKIPLVDMFGYFLCFIFLNYVHLGCFLSLNFGIYSVVGLSICNFD